MRQLYALEDLLGLIKEIKLNQTDPPTGEDCQVPGKGRKKKRKIKWIDRSRFGSCRRNRYRQASQWQFRLFPRIHQILAALAKGNPREAQRPLKLCLTRQIGTRRVRSQEISRMGRVRTVRTVRTQENPDRRLSLKLSLSL
jgi:hypothetical protein